jgi:hypothetical protein
MLEIIAEAEQVLDAIYVYRSITDVNVLRQICDRFEAVIEQSKHKSKK